jgi:hypothetical protein
MAEDGYSNSSSELQYYSMAGIKMIHVVKAGIQIKVVSLFKYSTIR